MAGVMTSRGSILLIFCIVLVLLPGRAAAFGAGNIPGIAEVEGHNWRHGDIEDMLKTLAFLNGRKWTSMMIKRVYFGNWLRDYSQAIDVGSLKGVPAESIRILVWVLSFLSFGYATEEFEVTAERMGVYRAEEHIDNPKGYGDGVDARKFDQRLRGPVDPAELEVDHQTGMKNYIANERGGWATSTGYVKFSLGRSIHFGRLYTHGAGNTKGKEADLCEALRCLGQALHCMEDFSAHSNYCELVLRELGYNEVFAHCGHDAQINLHGHRVYPIVTGTFGAVDFLHSVLGEATDHFTQSEVDELDLALKNAEEQSRGFGQRGFDGPGGGNGVSSFPDLLSSIPGLGGDLAQQARDLQAQSRAQEEENEVLGYRDDANTNFPPPSGSAQPPSGPSGQPQNPTGGQQASTGGASNTVGIPGTKINLDPVKTAKQIYPILAFRDKIVRAIHNIIAKIPGLEKLVERISETITVFIMSLLAPFVRPIIKAVSKSLKDGSNTVVKASADQQFGPWNDSHCTDPTHSMLSKDHFSNELNSCAGRVGATVLQYVVPRVLYAWQNTGVPVEEVFNDVLRAFHHPAIRDERIEIQRNMFNTVKRWVDEHPNRGNLNNILSSQSVKAGRNHKEGANVGGGHTHNTFAGFGLTPSNVWHKISNRDLDELNDGDEISRDASPFTGNPTPNTFGYSDPQWSSSPQPQQQQQQQGPPSQGYGQPEGQYQGGQYQQAPQGQGGYYQGGPPPPQGGQGWGGPPPPFMGGPPPPGGGWGTGPPPPMGSPYQQPPPPQYGYGPPPPNQYPGQGQGGYPGQGYPGQGYSGGRY